MKNLFITLYLFFNAFNIIHSQSVFLKPINDITVWQDNTALKYPFVGGLTSVQIAKADMQQDGFEDLIVFDIFSNRFLVLKNNANQNYILDTSIYAFPNVQNWVEIFDYNCDAIPDLFTYNNIGSIEIYRGEYFNNILQFSKKQNQILTQSFFGNNVNVYASAIDKPSFSDINNDGDIDIIGFNVFANKLIYYENQRIELNLPCDSFFCRIQDFCWGNISESYDDGTINLRDTCSSKFLNTLEQNNIMHNGSNVVIEDINSDGIKDALIGDLFFNDVSYLENNGNLSYASFLTQTKNFPSQKKIAIDFLPLAQFLDINHDGRKDMIVSNFSYTSVDANQNNIWYYQNTSTNNSINLEFIQEDFLLQDIIDVGKNSYPCFVDFNQDGLLDLLISNGGQKSSAEIENRYFIYAYENIGNYNEAKFNLIDTNFLNIAQHQLSEIAITAGDIDNDLDIDLIAGTENGVVVWWENISTTNQIPNYQYKGILLYQNNIPDTIGRTLTPLVYDLDKDNLNDLIIGNRNGNLFFYKGTNAITPNFYFENNALSNINTKIGNEVFGYAAPTMADLDSNQIDDLILGTYSNGIYWYKDFSTRYTQTNLTPEILSIKNLSKHVPAIYNNKQIFVGNAIGGISVYKMDTTTIITSIHTNHTTQLNVYPNPSKNICNLTLENNEEINSIQISNLLGDRIVPKFEQQNQYLKINIQDLQNGIYYIFIYQKNKHYIAKLLIE
jgi:hypothetical protein